MRAAFFMLLAVSCATPACETTGDPDDAAGVADTVGGDTTGADVMTPHVVGANDRVLMKTGDPVGSFTIGRIAQFGIADTEVVGAHVELRKDDTSLGSGIVQWREASDEVVALVSPDAFAATFGGDSFNYAMFDAAGFTAFSTQGGCVGLYDGELRKRLCADDPALEAGGHFALRGLTDGVATLEITRSGTATRSFELLGIHATNPPIAYAYPLMATTGADMTDIRDFTTTATSKGGVAVLASGRIPSVGGAFFVARADGVSPPSVYALTHDGLVPFATAFPGAGPWPDGAKINHRSTFGGVTANDAGDVAILYAPQLADGTAAATSGIYSFDQAGATTRRHVDLGAPLSYTGGASMVQYAGRRHRLVYGLTDDRRVMLVAQLVDGTTGVWREDSAGQLVTLMTSGDPATDDQGAPLAGLTFEGFGSIVTSGTGALMVTARVAGAGVEATNAVGAWGVGARNATPRLLARIGDPMPGTEFATILAIRLTPGVHAPDPASPTGLFARGLDDDNAAAFGGADDSHAIRPTSCGEATLHLTGGGVEALVLRGLALECPPETTQQVKVNSLADGVDAMPGDGSCDTGAKVGSGDPECTLRAAMMEANANASFNLIEFELEGAGPHTIAPASPLPTLTSGVRIIGPAATETPSVTIDGAAAGQTSGIIIEQGVVTLTRLRITGFSEDGVTSDAWMADLKLSSVLINQNCGWGVRSQATIVDSADGGFPSQIAFNGAGAGCEAGGLLALNNSFDSVALRLSDTLVHDNNGPGIVAAGDARLSGVTVEANNAQGVSIFGDGNSLRFELGDSTVANNLGVGILADTPDQMHAGEFGSLTVTGNGSWGIYSEGVVRLGNTTTIPTTRNVISDNGRGTACREWSFDADDELGALDLPCPGGGVFVAGDEDDLNSFFGFVDIVDNAGPGVITLHGVELSSATIRRNAGPGIAQGNGQNGGEGETIRVLALGGGSFPFVDQRPIGGVY